MARALRVPIPDCSSFLVCVDQPRTGSLDLLRTQHASRLRWADNDFI